MKVKEGGPSPIFDKKASQIRNSNIENRNKTKYRMTEIRNTIELLEIFMDLDVFRNCGFTKNINEKAREKRSKQ